MAVSCKLAKNAVVGGFCQILVGCYALRMGRITNECSTFFYVLLSDNERVWIHRDSVAGL
jgi:hypothetical protein